MKLFNSDCLDILKGLPDNSVDSVVTDPPYGISFMGKKWDYDVPSIKVWEEVYRVLKHGGHALVACGTRTQHRMAVNLEDAGFEIRDIVAWVYGSGFPKSLNIGAAVNKLETKEWSAIGKALDNIDQRSIIEVWKTNSNNVKIVETQSLKNQTIAGQDMPRENFVVLSVVQNNNQEKSNLLVSFVEKNLKEAQAINIKINTALQNVETEIKQLQDNVKSVEQQSQSQNHKSWNIFTAQCDVKEWLKENTTVNHKVDEALKTLRGNKKYSNEEITNVLCAVLTENLKHTILNQSKTFQSLDTKLQMECVSAINVIITEYTAENLISNTVDILKGKAIDKLQGNEREIVGEKILGGIKRARPDNAEGFSNPYTSGQTIGIETKGNSAYEGWGTALKPAMELFTLIRKPLSEKTVAENVLKWGTGGINIDGCRVEFQDEADYEESTKKNQHADFGTKPMTGNNTYGDWSMIQPQNYQPAGRFPANFIHDGSPEVLELFPNDSQRFFYCAKASKSERNAGLDDNKNHHPTVKPLKLMQYLCRLITPEGGIVLDPFMGSGSTGIGAKLAGFNFIGIELNHEYFKIAEARIEQAGGLF